MKKLILISTVSLVNLLLFAEPIERVILNPITPSAKVGNRIPIDAKRWYQVSNVTNGLERLFDDQTDEPVNTGYNKLIPTYDAYYPLLDGEKLSIKAIRFFDGDGSNTDAPLTLSIITAQWQRIPIARFVGDKYDAWVGPDPDHPDQFTLKAPIDNARYLVINTSGAFPNEIELYGTYQPGQAPSPAPHRATPFAQAVGVNAFEWNLQDATTPWQIDESRMPAIKAFSAMRHYIDWQKLEDQPGEYSFNPTFSGSWNYDAIYERLKTEGILVLACIKTLPKWLENTYPQDQQDYENIPARYGADLTLPQSYIEQARVAFQFAARYGHNKALNPALVKVSARQTWAGTNQVKVGMGLVSYIECDNERDKTWKGRQAYQSAREYAANLSAFYDGHNNSLGAGVGVKNADASIQVVIGGLAASSTDYVRAMIDWCREHRGYKADGKVNLCWDVINQHLYSNDVQSSQAGGSSRGAAPELSGVGGQAKAFVQLSHEQCYDMPVWITEAGYDLNQASPLKAVAIGSKSVEAVQADWLLRTALLYTRVGIDRLFFYQLYDDDPSVPIQFYSMGLINQDKTRKPAADYLSQARQLIGAYRYQETLSQDPLVDRYTLNGRSAYVLLIPDEKARTATYTLDVGSATTVQLHTPKIGSDKMAVSTLNAVNGKVAINVSETPVFVIPGQSSAARVSAELAETEEKALASLLMYPNPSTDYIELAFESNNNSPVAVNVYDASLGRMHKQVNLLKSERMFKQKVDLKGLPCGLFVVEVRQGTERVLRKLIKVQ